MSNIATDPAIPGTGFGILHPILKSYRFRVSFLNRDKQPLAYSSWLTRQAVSISQYVQCADKGEATPETLFIKIEEDVAAFAAKGIQMLLEEEDFTLRMETMDGNEGVIKTVDIENAWVDRVFHSEMDYGSGFSHWKDRTVLKLEIPEIQGQAINIIRDKDPAAEMIFQLLAGSQLTLRAEPEYDVGPEATVLPVLAIGYNSGSVKVTFG